MQIPAVRKREDQITDQLDRALNRVRGASNTYAARDVGQIDRALTEIRAALDDPTRRLTSRQRAELVDDRDLLLDRRLILSPSEGATP